MRKLTSLAFISCILYWDVIRSIQLNAGHTTEFISPMLWRIVHLQQIILNLIGTDRLQTDTHTHTQLIALLQCYSVLSMTAGYRQTNTHRQTDAHSW